jgi:hypothetical protein
MEYIIYTLHTPHMFNGCGCSTAKELLKEEGCSGA